MNRKITCEKQKKSAQDIKCELPVLERRIKKKFRKHLRELGIIDSNNGRSIPTNRDKDFIRLLHLEKKREKLKCSSEFLKKKTTKLLEYFASGNEVIPKYILPRIELIKSGTIEAELFRFASLTWSIPVSEGYGRRMRFLVWDDFNGKLIGLIALGDPVFNLNARDEIIGWNANERKERLAFIMDAYVLGAIPPYNMLLCGKLLACLVRTKEICKYFSSRYKNTRGLISGKKKRASLVMVTTSSALGRSSVYNRLNLNSTKYFESVGYTSGYGHFHVPGRLFEEMRKYLSLKGHPYFEDNRFGNGPNWKLRTIRAVLELIGMDRNLLNHGIKREVFICRLAKNAEKVLRGENEKPYYDGLLSTKEVSNLALERWVLPRANRRPEFIEWHREDIKQLIY